MIKCSKCPNPAKVNVSETNLCWHCYCKERGLDFKLRFPKGILDEKGYNENT